MKVPFLLVAFVPFLLSTTSLVFAEKSTQQYLEEGNEFLTKGNYDDALKSFEAAIGKFYFKNIFIFIFFFL